MTFEPNGSFSDPAKSEQIFDVDADALFTNGVRTPEGIAFASFGGNVYVVDDSGEAPELQLAEVELGHLARPRGRDRGR